MIVLCALYPPAVPYVRPMQSFRIVSSAYLLCSFGSCSWQSPYHVSFFLFICHFEFHPLLRIYSPQKLKPIIILSISFYSGMEIDPNNLDRYRQPEEKLRATHPMRFI